VIGFDEQPPFVFLWYFTSPVSILKDLPQKFRKWNDLPISENGNSLQSPIDGEVSFVDIEEFTSTHVPVLD